MFDLFRQLVARMNQRYICRTRVSWDGAPYTRKLRLERLETRELLDVSLPVAESALVERTDLVAPVAPSAPVALVALRNEPSTEISFNLVESSTLDFGGASNSASEDAGFVIDGVRYESYETLRTRPLNFGASDSVDSSPTPLDSQLGASPMVLRSGGGSGEPETWNIEVTSTLSSSLSDLSDEYTNPLLEHRSGWSGGTADARRLAA